MRRFFFPLEVSAGKWTECRNLRGRGETKQVRTGRLPVCRLASTRDCETVSGVRTLQSTGLAGFVKSSLLCGLGLWFWSEAAIRRTDSSLSKNDTSQGRFKLYSSDTSYCSKIGSYVAITYCEILPFKVKTPSPFPLSRVTNE